MQTSIPFARWIALCSHSNPSFYILGSLRRFLPAGRLPSVLDIASSYAFSACRFERRPNVGLEPPVEAEARLQHQRPLALCLLKLGEATAETRYPPAVQFSIGVSAIVLTIENQRS